jgi:hypothetical protein
VRLESHGTEDWVKVMCGGLRSETEERKKRGRKVRAGSAHAKVKEDGEGAWLSMAHGAQAAWRARRRGPGERRLQSRMPWRERRPAGT